MKKNIVITDCDPYNEVVQDGIGRRIKECRLERGLTPSQLACALGYKTSSPICKIESGDLKLGADKLYELSQILNVSSDYLLFGDVYSKGYEDIIDKMGDLDIIELEVINNFLGDIITKLGEGAVV